MAYTPVGWQTGDTITADRLNKMDNGWSVTSNTTTLCDETVTTEDDDVGNVAYLSVSETITAETIDVTFAGTKYTCAKNGEVYGGAGFDFTVYPFMLYDDGTIYTETAGTYTVKVEVAESAVETSADFDKARGYGYVTGIPTELFSETVTTSGSGIYRATLAYNGTIDAASITVTFDGTEYTCPRIDSSGGYFYGGFSGQGPTFTEFPFCIMSNSGTNTVYTETAGTHTIAVTVTVTSMQTSEDFCAAVNATELLPFRCVPNVTTYAEMRAAANAGRLLYFYVGDNNFHLVIRFVDEVSATAVTAYPEGVENVESFGFNSSMVFAVFNY